MKKTFIKKGFSLIEFVVAIAIFVAIGTLVTLFGRDIFSFNSHIQSDLGVQFEGRRAIVRMTSEMREMSPSSLGAYPISAAATSSITFFSDIDNDALKEQIRYYVQGTAVMKSVIKPSGSPLTYSSGSAVVSTVVSRISNGTSTPVFSYYDDMYAGTTTPLSIPGSVSSIRLVNINMILPKVSSSGTTSAIYITSQVTPRNLKDNL